MGVNADGRRELLGLQVGEGESEGFWKTFMGSLIAAGFCEAVGPPGHGHRGPAFGVRPGEGL